MSTKYFLLWFISLMTASLMAQAENDIPFPVISTDIIAGIETNKISASSAKEISSVLNQWEKYKTREFAVSLFKNELSKENSQPLLLWEWGGRGNGYKAIMVSTKFLVYVEETAQKPWKTNIIRESPEKITSVHNKALDLIHYRGNASVLALDAPTFFCTIWQEKKIVNSFVVYPLSIYFVGPMKNKNPEFCNDVKDAATLWASIWELIKMNTRDESKP